ALTGPTAATITTLYSLSDTFSIDSHPAMQALSISGSFRPRQTFSCDTGISCSPVISMGMFLYAEVYCSAPPRLKYSVHALPHRVHSAACDRAPVERGARAELAVQARSPDRAVRARRNGRHARPPGGGEAR